jgi:hypothetical protein
MNRGGRRSAGLSAGSLYWPVPPAGLAKTIDFDHPGRDRALGRLPDKAAGETVDSARRQMPSIASFLPARGLTRYGRPRLALLFDGRDRLGAWPSVNGWTFKHQWFPSRDRSMRRLRHGRPSERHGETADAPWLTVWARFARRPLGRTIRRGVPGPARNPVWLIAQPIERCN